MRLAIVLCALACLGAGARANAWAQIEPAPVLVPADYGFVSGLGYPAVYKMAAWHALQISSAFAGVDPLRVLDQWEAEGMQRSVFLVLAGMTTTSARLAALRKLYLEVALTGSASGVGIDSAALAGHARRQLAADLSGIPILDEPPAVEEMQREGIATLRLTVWTVGESYPVAYHVGLRVGDAQGGHLYHDAVLGYASSRQLGDTIRDSIDRFLERFAMEYYKARNAQASTIP